MPEYYSLHVSEFSPELQSLIPQLTNKIHVFEYLPLIALRSSSDVASLLTNVPAVLGVHPTGPDSIRVTVGIDVLLQEAHKAQSTLKENGWDEDLPVPVPPGFCPPYPYLDTNASRPQVEFDPSLVLPTRVGVMSAINLSMGTNVHVEFSPHDPVNVSTRAAAEQIPVVVAAGNWGKGDSEIGLDVETMSAWSEAPWVISVGATDRVYGGKLLKDSSRGSASTPTSGPTVVAWGRSDFPPFPRKTSFAAPRVSIFLSWFAAYCLCIRHFVRRLQGESDEGVPLVGYGLIDRDMSPEAMKRDLPLSALPATGIEFSRLASVWALLLARTLRPLNIWPNATVLRKMLISSAQPMPMYQRHEVGHGFVGFHTTRRYLANFSGADFADLFAPEVDIEDTREQLTGLKLTKGRELVHLLNVWQRSRRRWVVDIRNMRLDLFEG